MKYILVVVTLFGGSLRSFAQSDTTNHFEEPLMALNFKASQITSSKSSTQGSELGSLECANQDARKKMTSVLNFHRSNAGLDPVTEESIFGRKMITNHRVTLAFVALSTLGELRDHLLKSSAVQEADRAFSQSSAPVSNMASWAMNYTIARLGKPDMALNTVFCKSPLGSSSPAISHKIRCMSHDTNRDVQATLDWKLGKYDREPKSVSNETIRQWPLAIEIGTTQNPENARVYSLTYIGKEGSHAFYGDNKYVNLCVRQ